MNKTQELECIKRLLIDTFERTCWHGKSLKKILEQLDHQQALQAPSSGNRSIWELVLHIIVWRTVPITWMEGNPDYQIEFDTPQDFPLIEDPSTSAWQQTLKDLQQSQEKLLTTINTFDPEQLHQNVGTRNYSYYELLHGIIHHDIYHGGQIALLLKPGT